MSIVIFHFCRRKFYGEPAVMNYKWNFQNFCKQKIRFSKIGMTRFQTLYTVNEICVFFMHPFFAVCGESQLLILVCTFLLGVTIYIELQKSNLYWHVQDSQGYLLI